MGAIARSKTTRKVRLIMSFLLIVSTLAWTFILVRPPMRVYAAMFVVDDMTNDLPDANLDDTECKASNGNCTLRAAIEQANYLGDATNSIDVPGGTLTLTSGDIKVTSNITIKGDGIASTTIDANKTGRVFYVVTDAVGYKVSLSDMTLKNGLASTSVYTPTTDGGAIWNSYSTLELKDVAVNDSQAEYGGGLVNEGGIVTLENVSFSGNTATSEGGAIHSYTTDAQISLTDVVLQNNTAGVNGGGLYVDKETQGTVKDSAIIGNQVINRDGVGGGVYVFGTVTMENTRIASNKANPATCDECSGGGIAVATIGNLTLNQCTIEKNVAYDQGGGVYNLGKTLITNSKIQYNDTIHKNGAGVYNDSNPTGDEVYGMTIQSSDIYSNTANFTQDAVWPDTSQPYIDGDFFANGGGIANDINGSMLLENSTVRENTSYTEGGGMMNRGKKARINNVSFTNNQAKGAFVKFPWYTEPKWNAEGGALLNESPDTIVTNSSFTGNRATNAGGAIANKQNLKIYDSLIDGNTSANESPIASLGSGSGGGIDTYYGTSYEDLLEIKRTTISNNTAEKQGGVGGIGGAISATSAQVKISESTIISNTSDSDGGAIYMNVRPAEGGGTHYRTFVELKNVTLSNNTAKGSGGAISNDTSGTVQAGDTPSRLQMTNVTIVNNTATSYGGGVYNLYNSGGTSWIKNSIIAQNNAANGKNCADDTTPPTSSGYNVSNDCAWFTGTGDQNNVADVYLSNLGNYGGSTFTHALLPGSPAFTNVPVAGGQLTIDQRNKPRTTGTGKYDSGAFETQAPVAANDTATTRQSQTINAIPVLNNDVSDPKGYLKVDSVIITSTPTEGTATANADGTITYVAGVNEGTFYIKYTVTDQHAPALTSNTGTVTVTVSSNQAPTVSNFTKSTNEDTKLTFIANDFSGHYTDPESNPMLKVKIVSLPEHGTLSLTDTAVVENQEITTGELEALAFMPEENWNGQTSFTWNASDQFNYAASDATVTINVAAINDVPTLDDVSKTTNEDIAVSIPAADFAAKFSDPDSTLAKVKITSLPEHGVLKLSGNAVNVDQEIAAADLANLIFEPEAHWHGFTSFGWNGSDGTNYAASNALVLITVNSIEDKPVVSDFSKTELEDNPILFADTDFTEHFNDADGDSLVTLNMLSLPEHGTLKLRTANVTETQKIATADIGFLTFEPETNWHGETSFNWNASDGKAVADAPAKVTITINEINDRPDFTGVADIVKRVDEDHAVGFTATDFSSKFFDTDGDPLTKIKITSLTTGTLAITRDIGVVPVDINQEFTVAELDKLFYTPDPDWNGTTGFDWTGSDGTAYAIGTARVKIIVTSIADPPIARDDIGATTADKYLDVVARDGVLQNDSDPEGGLLLVQSHDLVSTKGVTVVVKSNGGYGYDPRVSDELQVLNAGESVIDTFKYVIVDTDGLTATGTISVTVYGKGTQDDVVQGPLATATAIAQQETAAADQEAFQTAQAETAVVQTATTIANDTATAIAAPTVTAQAQTAIAEAATAAAVETAAVETAAAETAAAETAAAEQTAVAQTATATVMVTTTATVTVTTTPTPTITTTPTPTITATPTVSPTVTPDSQPTLEVNHTSGKPGSKFTFTARNYPPNSQGSVAGNGQQIGSITIGNDGTKEFILDTTDASPGSYTVKVTVDTGTGVAATYEASVTLQLVEDGELRETSPDTNAPVIKTGGSSQNTVEVYLPVVQRPQ